MLEEYMLDLGYNTDQIKIIQNTYPKRVYSESTLLFNLKNLYNFLRRNGVLNKEFIILIALFPHLYDCMYKQLVSKYVAHRLPSLAKQVVLQEVVIREDNLFSW